MSGPRRFDHEEAVRRWQAGETQTDLAAEYGVTKKAVSMAILRLTDPEWVEQNRTYHREYMRRTLRVECPGCGGIRWAPQGARREQATGLCIRCKNLASATTVRDDTLRCSECEAWKPDEEFPFQQERIARRGRHSVCRGCQASSRQRRRETRKVPCTNCGALRLHPLDAGGRVPDSGLCRDCWQQSPECIEALRRGNETRWANSERRRAAA